MYACKNCAGNVKFDIKSQKMHCDYCDAYYEPAEVEKESDTLDTECFDVTVFTCPQCGAEIMASENSAAEFCLYCGGSSILSSRIDREKRPDYIIPFKKTKEDCIQAYKKRMAKALFAPNELKDPQYLDKFRGIYMPYWVYRIKQEGAFNLKAKKVSHSGNYEITKHYEIQGNLDAEYNGLSHDASSYFADPTTECLAPYHNKDVIPFTPALMSGFYADTSDVSAELYAAENCRLATEETYKKIERDKMFRGFSVERPSGEKMNESIHTNCTSTEHAVYPVWFLTYRNKDRVMFATVNGQTGKVAADIPIDKKKYIFGSLLLAIPIFMFLNIFLVMKPSTVMCLAAMIALIATVIFNSEIKKLYKRDSGVTDRGKLNKRERQLRENMKKNKADAMSLEEMEALKETAATIAKKQTTVKPKDSNAGFFLFMCIAFCIGIGPFISMVVVLLFFIPFVALIASLVLSITGCKRLRQIEKDAEKMGEMPESGKATGRWNLSGFLFPLMAIAVSCIVYILNPAGDWWFYGAACLSCTAVLVAICGIIEKYNLLSTHGIPQLHNRGGENDVQ